MTVLFVGVKSNDDSTLIVIKGYWFGMKKREEEEKKLGTRTSYVSESWTGVELVVVLTKKGKEFEEEGACRCCPMGRMRLK